MKFSIKDFLSKLLGICYGFPQFPVDLVTFTEETLNRKLHILCSVTLKNSFMNILPGNTKSKHN